MQIREGAETREPHHHRPAFGSAVRAVFASHVDDHRLSAGAEEFRRSGETDHLSRLAARADAIDHRGAGVHHRAQDRLRHRCCHGRVAAAGCVDHHDHDEHDRDHSDARDGHDGRRLPRRATLERHRPCSRHVAALLLGERLGRIPTCRSGTFANRLARSVLSHGNRVPDEPFGRVSIPSTFRSRLHGSDMKIR